MNDLVTFAGGLPANPEDLEAGLQNLQQSVQGGTGGTPFLRLLKSGVWVYGAENIEVEEGSEWAINPYSLNHGFACWGDGELLDERMVPFTQSPPNKAELPDMGYEWNQQVAMMLACVSGEDTGVQVLLKGTSLGLRNATKDLINALIAQLQHDKVHIVPIVELESDSYQHKKHGQIFYPVIEISRWASMDAEDAPAPEESEAETTEAEATEPAPKPKGRSRKAAADSEAEQAPRRRRRRRNG